MPNQSATATGNQGKTPQIVPLPTGRRVSPRSPSGTGRPPRRVGKRASQLALADLVELYLDDVRARLRPKSVEAYSTALHRVLMPYLDEARITYPEDVDQRALTGLAGSLARQVGPRGKPLAVETRRSYLRQIDFFWAWLEREGYTGRLRNPKPRAEHKITRTLEREQLEAMMHALPHERDRLMLQVLIETGMRVGELVRLDVDDLESEPGYRRQWLHVRAEASADRRQGAKDHQDRRLPVAPALYHRLRRYVDELRPDETMSPALFLNKWRSRESGLYDPVTTDSVHEVVKRAGRRAGIDLRAYPGFGPHLLRKSFTRLALSRGMDSEKLRVVLGHADTRMIREVYGQLQSEDVYSDLMKVLYQDRRR